jgi:hypothetical protein
MRSINKRCRRIIELIGKYNTQIDKLRDDVKKPSKLDVKKVDQLCFSDEFWELEISFKCSEKWALSSKVRQAIDAMYHSKRAREEIFILCKEAERYFAWLTSRLDRCQRLLSVVDVKSSIGIQIVNVGERTACALSRLGGLAVIRLAEEETFKSFQESIRCISSRLSTDFSDK